MPENAHEDGPVGPAGAYYTTPVPGGDYAEGMAGRRTRRLPLRGLAGLECGDER